jgi:hypothetical protein
MTLVIFLKYLLKLIGRDLCSPGPYQDASVRTGPENTEKCPILLSPDLTGHMHYLHCSWRVRGGQRETNSRFGIWKLVFKFLDLEIMT